MTGQSRKHSIIESISNVASGMIIAFGISQLAHYYQEQIQLYIWSGFIWNLSAGSNAIMTTILTVISVIRGYFWRRAFNNITIQKRRNK